MAEYLFSEQQEKRLLEITDVLAASERMRKISGFSPESVFYIPEKAQIIVKEFTEKLFEGFKKDPPARKVRNERLEMLVNNDMSCLLKIAHILLITEQEGYTFELYDKLQSKIVGESIMKSTAYQKLVADPCKENPPIDDLADENIKLLSNMRKLGINPLKMKRALGHPELKVIAELEGAEKTMFLIGNNYDGAILHLLPKDEIDVLHLYGNNAIYKIGAVELWLAENKDYLDEYHYNGLLEFLRTGTSASMSDNLFIND